ncbi:MAG TPA: hypothetical protein VGA37_09940 [Gemmatimonadales bacterium]
MPFYRCTICHDDGRPVAEDISVMIEETTRDDGTAWYGTVTVSHLTELTPGQRYRLRLEDGRAGDFQVRRNTFAGGTDRAVAINGTGPLK